MSDAATVRAGLTAGRGGRLLQWLVAAGCCVPILTGGAGVLLGPAFVGAAFGGELGHDSHFRYLSGLLLGLGLAFASTVPGIERHGGRVQVLGALVVVGGLGRLWSLFEVGPPSFPHLAALVMELVVTPAVVAWQWWVAAGAMARRA